MQGNPYDSPASPGGSPTKLPTHARAGDCTFVGLVWGGTIGAASGAATAICLLGWIAMASDHRAAANVGELAMVEGVISIAIVRITLGAVVGVLAGVPLGAALGLLAGKFRFRNPRSLTAIAASLSAVTAALCAGLIRLASHFMNSRGDASSCAVLLIIAIAAGGIGGAVLGRKLSVLSDSRSN